MMELDFVGTQLNISCIKITIILQFIKLIDINRYSRNGREIAVINNLTLNFPQSFFEGELWYNTY